MERPEKMLMYLIGHTGFAVLYALLITLRKEIIYFPGEASPLLRS
jgi:hypothetical protein